MLLGASQLHNPPPWSYAGSEFLLLAGSWEHSRKQRLRGLLLTGGSPRSLDLLGALELWESTSEQLQGV